MDSQHLPAVNAGAPVPAYPPQRFEPEYYPEEEPKAGPNLKRYLAAVRRYRWLVLALVGVGIAAGIAASRYVSLRYAAEATFWFDVTSQSDQVRAPIQSSELLESDAWIELLRSFAVLDHVVRTERLYLEHEPADAALFSGFALDSMFRPGSYRWQVSKDGRTAQLKTAEGVVVETARRGQPVGRGAGLLWQPPAAEWEAERDVAFTVLVPREASKQMAQALSTRLASGGNFLSVGYSDEDPERAAAVVNTLADRYIEVATDLKTEKLSQLRQILATQLEYAQQNLVAAEMSLEGFRVQTITLPSETGAPLAPGLEATRDPVFNSFFGMRIERDAIERDRDAIRRAISSPNGTSVDALATLGAVRNSPELSAALTELTERRAELRALTQKYTDEHPLVQRAQADVADLETRAIPQLAQGLVAELDSRVGVLDGTIGSASSELRQIPTRAIEEARHRRSVSIAENLYNDLRRRYEGARLAEEAAVPDIRILDRATVPTRPVNDPRITTILLGIVAGLGAGVLLAILLDRADPRLRYVEQVTGDPRLQVIGAVPNLRKGLAAGQEDTARVLESLRAVRLSLMHAYGAAGPIAVTVTSPGASDGKTFITSNLALTFADLGMKTLVIDGDTRRGRLHHLLELQRVPGLTDYLGGDAPLEDVIRSTRYPLIDVLPSGRRRADSPELLSSSAMGTLLARIKPQYQVILIDSPPLGAGVDPLVLGTLTGNMLLVLRTGQTERALIDAKLQMVERLPIRLLGVVMNGFETGESSYRYYSYLPGYEARSEDAEHQALQPAQS